MDLGLSKEEIDNIVDLYDIFTYNFMGEVLFYDKFKEISEHPLSIMRFFEQDNSVFVFNRISNIQLKLSMDGDGGWLAFLSPEHEISVDIMHGMFDRNIDVISHKYDMKLHKRQWTVKHIVDGE